MKNIVLSLVFLLSALTATAQVASTYFEGKDAFEVFPFLWQMESRSISAKIMPPFDIDRLLEEDKYLEGLDMPFRFGHGFDVDYTMKDGTWLERNSLNIWRLQVISPGAYSLNFIFDELYLTPGAELYIFNTEGSMVYGPVTEKQNPKEGKFLTDLVAGEEVVIQISEPSNSKEKSYLKISRVVHAYKNVYPFITEENSRPAEYSCHNDVVCYSSWAQESDGVARILLSTADNFCTGSLLNNTVQDLRPYLLTAFHCIDIGISGCRDGVLSSNEKSATRLWTIKFSYKKTSCSGSNIYTAIDYNGAEFRAAWINTDFALVELREAIDTHHVRFLGWDRSGNPPVTGTVIHHPKGDLMKISFDLHNPVPNSTLYDTQVCNIMFPANTMWVVGLDNGTTEDASSGAPLFDINKRVVGQLYGGVQKGCPPVTKYFGRLKESWTGGGTNDTSLSSWLAPNYSASSAPNTVNSYGLPPPPAPVISGYTPMCSGTPRSFSASNWQPGYTWYASGYLSLSVTKSSPTIVTVTSSAVDFESYVSVKNRIGVEVARYNLWIGRPVMYITGPTSVTAGDQNYYNVYPTSNLSGPLSNYTWYMSAFNPSPPPATIYPNVNWASIWFWLPGTYMFSCRTTNACGMGNYADFFVSAGRGSSSSVVNFYPNPVSDILYVEINPPAHLKAPPTYDLRLYDGKGNLLEQHSANGGSVQFHVSALPDGNYYLHIYDGVSSTPEMHQIIVEH